ncbi:MAG TPA: AMP-binding protein [Alphaproteobacteria bacterium]|jgi:fatty-acyl-CoA synthase
MNSTLAALVGAAPGAASAIRYGGRDIAYGEISARAARIAGALAALGIRPGDRVALWLPNAPAWIELLFALARLGAVAVAVNTRFRAVEVADIVGRSRARALVLWPGFKNIDFLGILEAVDPASLDRLETIVVYDEGEAPAALPAGLATKRMLRYADLATAAPLERGGGTAETGAAIFTTSGTTKAPKFVLHTQRSLVDHARAVAPALGYNAPDAVMLQALPFCGVFGLSQALATFAARRPMILLPAFEAESAARAVTAARVTHMNGSDEMYRRMLDAAPAQHPFPSLRRAGFAAFNSDPAEFVPLGDARGLPLTGLYGMSEIQALFASQSPDAPAAERARGGGRPVSPLARVRVRDPETGAILRDGGHGEIEAKGPSLMAGYADDPGATAAALTDDGYLRTGDLGYTVPGGFVFLARMGDALRLGGFLVNPTEISSHIEAHPAVAACQVVGAKTKRGERAVAFVVKRAGVEAGEGALIAHCRAGLASFKCPEAVIFLDAFPVAESANGVKIQRAKLRALAMERLGA